MPEPDIRSPHAFDLVRWPDELRPRLEAEIVHARLLVEDLEEVAASNGVWTGRLPELLMSAETWSNRTTALLASAFSRPERLLDVFYSPDLEGLAIGPVPSAIHRLRTRVALLEMVVLNLDLYSRYLLREPRPPRFRTFRRTSSALVGWTMGIVALVLGGYLLAVVLRLVPVPF